MRSLAISPDGRIILLWGFKEQMLTSSFINSKQRLENPFSQCFLNFEKIFTRKWTLQKGALSQNQSMWTFSNDSVFSSHLRNDRLLVINSQNKSYSLRILWISIVYAMLTLSSYLNRQCLNGTVRLCWRFSESMKYYQIFILSIFWETIVPSVNV